MTELVAIDIEGGPRFVSVLREVWDRGDAAFVLDDRLPPAARDTLLAAMRPTSLWSVAGERRLADSEPLRDGDALVVATSGSTGAPKGVVLTHSAVAASAEATSARLDVSPGDHWLACLPLAHIGGLAVVTRALHTRTALTIHPRFDAARVDAAAHGGATLVSLVGTALARVDAHPWRWIVLGGSRPPADRPSNSVATYGMTETGSGVVYDGRPLDGVDVRIDADGQILLRGPMLLRAYRDGTEPFDADGWFPTGDLGTLDASGTLSVSGRRGDMIVSGGEKVWPEAVEAVLVEMAGIADCAVMGVPDDEWGQKVVALVVPTDPARPPLLADIKAATRERLATYCAPREVVMVASIPRTPLGKVRRADLPRTSHEGTTT